MAEQHAKIDIRDVLCPSDGRFEYIGDDTLVSRVGSSLFFFSLSTTKHQDALRFPVGYTLDAWTISNQTNAGHGETQVVVALSGADTRIHVYSWPRLHLEQSYLVDTEVCYSRLSLSRDGRYLVGVSSESQIQLRFWDLQSPDIDIQISSDPSDQTNRLLRSREVTLSLEEEMTFLSFNPFNHTQVVVGNERTVQVVTILASTSFQLAALIPQQVALDSGLANRRVLSHTWLNDRQLLLSTRNGEILSVTLQTPASVLALRGGTGDAQASGDNDLGEMSAAQSTAGDRNNQTPHQATHARETEEMGIANMTDADLALLGLIDPKAPTYLNPDWRGVNSPSTAANGVGVEPALPVTVWACNLPNAPIGLEGATDDLDNESTPDLDESEAGVNMSTSEGRRAASIPQGPGNAVGLCLGLTRHEVVVGTNDGCLLWLNKHTQAVTHQQHIDMSTVEPGILHLAFSPSFSTFIALTKRGQLRLFKPLSDRAAPPSTSSEPTFQTSSLGYFPLAVATDVTPITWIQPHQHNQPRSMQGHRQPIRVGHVIIPTHPSDLHPKNFKLISYNARGMLQVWGYGTRQLIGTYHFNSGCTSAAVSSDGLLCIVGLESGAVNILDLSNPTYMRLIFSHRFHSGPVQAIEFNRDGDVWATMGPQKIFFVRTGDFKLLGYTKRAEWETNNETSSTPNTPKTSEEENNKTDTSTPPQTIFTSTIKPNQTEAEAQKAAARAVQEEKLKYDDEDELVAPSTLSSASVGPSSLDDSSLPVDSLQSMCWSTPADRESKPNDRLIVTTVRGSVYVLTAPNIYHDAPELKLDREFLTPVQTITDTPLTFVQSNLTDRTMIYATGMNKMLQVYNLQYDSTLKLLRKLNDDVPEEDVEEVGPDGLLHQRPCTVVCQALTGNLLVTSGRDGIITLRDGESLEYITRLPIHDYVVGGTISIGLSPDSSLLTSSGWDGSLLVLDLASIGDTIATRRTRKLRNLIQSIQTKVLDGLPEVDEWTTSSSTSEQSYLQTHFRNGSSGRTLKEHDLQQKILRDDLFKSLHTFKLQFQEILNRNSHLPELERLGFQDFAIDLELKGWLTQEGEGRVAAIREQIHSECIGKEYIIERIRQQCWDAMEVKGRMFQAFKSDLEVHNFPIRTLSSQESKRIRQIQFLRRMEIVEKRWRHAQSLKTDESDSQRDKNFVPSKFTEESTNYLMNMELERPEDGINPASSSSSSGGSSSTGKDKDSSKLKDSKTGGGLGGSVQAKKDASKSSNTNSKDDLPVENLPRFLLYHPIDVITPFKKRTQTMLLNLKIESLKKTFNDTFQEYYDMKQREMEHIHEKAKRIQEIQNELQMDVPVYRPIMSPDEIPHSVLTVEDSEIKSPKVLSKSERLAAESKAQRDAASKESQDDGPQRALELMMGGTLETKRDLSLLEQELVPEEWMRTTLPEAMTEEQKLEFSKFEKKVKLIQAEQETRRKLLQTELSKLKSDVSDIAKSFDAKFKSHLVDHRIHVQRDLYQHELMIIRLLNDLLFDEDKVHETFVVRKKITLLQTAQSTSKSLRLEFERTYRSSQTQYETMLSELKNLDRQFRKDLQNGGVSLEQQQVYNSEQATIFAELQARHDEIVEKLTAGLEVFDEDGQLLTTIPSPPQSAPPLGAGENLEQLYKLFRAKKISSKTNRKTKQAKMQIDAITGRAVRAGSSLGRLGLLGSMTATSSSLPSMDPDLKRGSSRERELMGSSLGGGNGGAAVGSAAAAIRKRRKDGEEDAGDGTMNPYPNDLLAHLTNLYTHHPATIAPGPNPQLLEDIKYLDLDERDKPESVDIDLWYALLERRQDYIDKEKDTRRYHYKLQEMSLHLQHLHELEQGLENELRGHKNYISNLLEARQIFAINTEVMLKIQQGQVEIEESPVVTDLKDCEMIDRIQVEKLNTIIKKQGGEKVDILKDTTVSRTAINLLEWTRKKLDLEHADSVDLTTELQLLRVTKSLQGLIKMGGHDNQKAAELKSLDRKIEFVSAANRDSLLGKKLKLMKVKKRIKQQNRENERLYETVQELEAAVKERMQISSIRDEGRLEESRAGAERMKALVTRRKLVDLAKLQSEEIKFLRDQVENLRRRTFASFAIPQLIPNPDERAKTSYAPVRPGQKMLPPPSAGGSGGASGGFGGRYVDSSRPHTTLPGIGRESSGSRGAPTQLPPVRPPPNGPTGTPSRDRAVTR